MSEAPRSQRTMDVHLLSQVPDDGSPFGVEYSTRRLSLEASGVVFCDDVDDPLWAELAIGVRRDHEEGSPIVTPQDGPVFLDHVRDYLRYQWLSPLTPVLYDHRGPWRPDNFRIEWRPSKRLYWGHGYVFGCERGPESAGNDGGEQLPVAALEGWKFYHDVGGSEGITDERVRPAPRIVVVNLRPPRDEAWKETVLGAGEGTRQTKAFVRGFLRRFFERCSIGIFPDAGGRSGPFVWQGGF